MELYMRNEIIEFWFLDTTWIGFQKKRSVNLNWLYLVVHNTFNYGMKCMISERDKKLAVVSKQQNWCLTFYKVH